MNTLGLISDTHGLLREDAVALLQGVDHIVHAGDIGNPTIVERLERVAPVSAIRGNVDVEPWASMFPDTLQVTLFGQKIFVIHDRKDMTFAPAMMGINLVISGHSHRASIESRDDAIYLNPGSAGPRRFRLPSPWQWSRSFTGDWCPRFTRLPQIFTEAVSMSDKGPFADWQLSGAYPREQTFGDAGDRRSKLLNVVQTADYWVMLLGGQVLERWS